MALPPQRVRPPGTGRSELPAPRYRVVPAAGFHVLTPWFDALAAVLGLGERFKSRVVKLAGIGDGDTVADIGCGSGLTAAIIQKQFPNCRMLAIDADPRILVIARRRRIREALQGMAVVCAMAERVALASGSVDIALSTLAFHHLPPRAKHHAAQEVARILRPGGTFLLVDLQPLLIRRRPRTEAEWNSPRLGLRTNTPQALQAAFRAVGVPLERIPAPVSWAMAPWSFALRGRKPDPSEPLSSCPAIPPRRSGGPH